MSETVPPGRTAGGPKPATAGGPKPGAAGQPDPFEGEIATDPEPLYELRLERNGSHRTVTAIEDVDIVREHTDLSDWQVVVPEDPTLPEWRFADVELRHRGGTLFEGQLQRINPSISGAETVLEGFGPGSELRFGHVRLDRRNANVYQVIEEVWNHYTPYDAVVYKPEEAQQFSRIEISGTPKDVLKQLHDRARMRFYFTMGDGDGPDAVSFRPGRIVRPSGWTRLDIDPTYDVGDYRNAVVVEGAYSEDLGRRYRGVAVDEDEINRIGQRLEESIGPEPALESDEDCQEIARRRLEERVAEDQQEGSIDILPRLMPPGVRVPVPYYDGDERDIDQVSYTESFGNAEAQVTFDKEYSVAERTEEVDTELDTTKEMIR